MNSGHEIIHKFATSNLFTQVLPAILQGPVFQIKGGYLDIG